MSGPPSQKSADDGTGDQERSNVRAGSGTDGVMKEAHRGTHPHSNYGTTERSRTGWRSPDWPASRASGRSPQRVPPTVAVATRSSVKRRRSRLLSSRRRFGIRRPCGRSVANRLNDGGTPVDAAHKEPGSGVGRVRAERREQPSATDNDGPEYGATPPPANHGAFHLRTIMRQRHEPIARLPESQSLAKTTYEGCSGRLAVLPS